MAESVYRVTEVIGVSSESWEAAARAAVETAAKTVRDLRIAEVLRQDLTIGDGGVVNFRVRLASRSSTAPRTDAGTGRRMRAARYPLGVCLSTGSSTRRSPSAARSGSRPSGTPREPKPPKPPRPAALPRPRRGHARGAARGRERGRDARAAARVEHTNDVNLYVWEPERGALEAALDGRAAPRLGAPAQLIPRKRGPALSGGADAARMTTAAASAPLAARSPDSARLPLPRPELGALLIAPAAWSAQTLGHATSGTVPGRRPADAAWAAARRRPPQAAHARACGGMFGGDTPR